MRATCQSHHYKERAAMSRSRSRGRAAVERDHGRRSRSRSREKMDSRSSYLRPRSRSASAGRDRSRSRERTRRRARRSSSPRPRHYASDTSSDGSDSDSRKRKRRHKEKKAKKSKKSKKESKSSKRSVERSLSPSPARHGLEDQADAGSEAHPKPTASITPTSTPLDAKSFFAQLQQQEASKQMVGTLHASGSHASVSATMNTAASEQWECAKAGCGHKNSKYAPSCNKCGAMKRLSEWR